jgi:hypothetical protein
MVGNKAGINDSIKKRRLKGSRHRRQDARSCKYERDRNGPRGSDCIAKSPAASSSARWRAVCEAI